MPVRLASIVGTVPPPGTWPTGCRFASRCQFAEDKCSVPFPAVPAHGVRLRAVHPGRRTAPRQPDLGSRTRRRRDRTRPLECCDDRQFRSTCSDAAADDGAPTPALQVRDLVVRYGSGRKAKRATPAVDGVSFDLAAGRNPRHRRRIGLGQVHHRQGGARPAASRRRARSGCRARTSPRCRSSSAAPLAVDLRVVFQDPYSSLNPARTIGQTLVEPLRLLGVGEAEADKRARESLQSVGLPGEAVDRYPSQFSGGQRQRIAIARALVCGRRSSSWTSRSARWICRPRRRC